MGEASAPAYAPYLPICTPHLYQPFFDNILIGSNKGKTAYVYPAY
jgi:hypothetical protein